MKIQAKYKKVIGVTFLVALLLFLVLAIGWVIYLPSVVSEIMTNFASIWNTTDAIQHYLGENQQWPDDWESLAPAMKSINGNLALARSRVEINFEVDLENLPEQDQWCVRMKSGRRSGEVSSANERLRRHHESLVGR